MDVTDSTFHEEVLVRSKDIPVVVDFWAPWCGPCRQLTPILERIAARRADEVVLAKVNIDESPALASTYRIQGIPAVKGFRDAIMVAEFTGAVPAASVEAFFDQVIPSVVDRLIAAGDEDSLREALVRDAGATEARVMLGQILMGDGRRDEAVEILEPAAHHDTRAQGLIARVDLAGSDLPDVAAALAALDRGDRESALPHLLDAIRTSSGEQRETLRRVMVGVFGELGDQDPLTVLFRRRLAQTLY